jgi:hypothetical protein
MFDDSVNFGPARKSTRNKYREKLKKGKYDNVLFPEYTQSSPEDP